MSRFGNTRPGSIRLATIRGVDLNVHASLILLLIYVIFVATAQFPAVAFESGVDPAALSGGPLLWGFVFALGLFVSVAIHEFGHAFTAQAQGTEVRGITLMMLGGVSEMGRIPEKPYAEFKLAIVGPLVSLALAGGLLMVRANTGSPELAFISYWLGSANLVLAIFNLIPAFPLDGGRALRSVLAARKGMVNATRTAVAISKGLAWALGLLGLLTFNILLMVIAFFIYSVAQSELSMLLARGILKGLNAGDVALPLRSLRPEDSLQSVADEMLKSRSDVLPVMGADRRVGLITLARIRQVPRQAWREEEISRHVEWMDGAVQAEEPVSQIIGELTASRSRALPVMQAGAVVGVIRAGDLNELLQLKSLEEQEERPDDRRVA